MNRTASIVMPTYNQAQYLPEALEGVFGQTYHPRELIVVNDGSTDDTSAVLADYRQLHNFTLIEQENQGLPRALNAGFARAGGEYLTWTSSDNIMLPEMLETLVHALEKDPKVGLVYSDLYLMDETGDELYRFNTIDYDPHWLLYTNLVHCSFLYRRACMDRVGGYDPDFHYSEDWEYWIRISKHHKMKHVPEVLYRYRVHGTTMTAELKQGTADEMGWRPFSAAVRRQMPIRWWVHRLKRCWAYLLPTGHPAVAKREAWMRATRRLRAGLVHHDTTGMGEEG